MVGSSGETIRQQLLPMRSHSQRSVLSTPSSERHRNASIRVLLVDDHTVLREGLRSIVSAHNHLEVVGEASDGVEAVELVQRVDPDVVVMDINMPNMDGIEATRRIKADRPDIVIIGLSVLQSEETGKKMKAAGATAYLTKESAADALCQAIEDAVSYLRGTPRQAC
jgi:DNA-binding NarL/FixJ family response regulator